jgi:1,2-diacylglycerol 3-beta-galactosyltransferase
MNILFSSYKTKSVDKCFVPSDALFQCARDRGVAPEQIVQLGLPIRKGFWASTPTKPDRTPNKNIFSEIFGSFGAAPQDNGGSSSKKNTAKSKFRDQLGLVDSLPTVLIVGGGDGMGGIIQQAKALGEKLNEKAESTDEAEYQMVVVCGNNENAQQVLSANEWGQGVNVVVNGFVNNMDEWMRASDVIVTKAGPGTIAEASICGLPCMLSSYL